MRITFLLSHAGLSGGVRVVATYAERLQRRGHEVTIVSTSYRWPRRRDRMRDAVRKLGRALSRRPEPSHLNGLDVARRVTPHDGPITDADVPDADVVVATFWKTALWADALSPAKGRRLHFVQGHEAGAGTPEADVDRAWALGLPKVCVAGWLADRARERFGDENVVVVRNSVDTDLFHAAPRGKQSAPTVGFMFDPRRYRGCDVAVAAIEDARARCPALRVTSFGSHAPGDGLDPPAAPFEHHCMPDQAHLREIYSSCDAWLFASRREGFGLPILEAMACRTPVIASAAGAAPDLVSDEVGALVDVEDADAMASAIVRIAEMDDESWRAMSERAHAVARGWTWDEATERFESALEDVAAGRPLHARAEGACA